MNSSNVCPTNITYTSLHFNSLSLITLYITLFLNAHTLNNDLIEINLRKKRLKNNLLVKNYHFCKKYLREL